MAKFDKKINDDIVAGLEALPEKLFTRHDHISFDPDARRGENWYALREESAAERLKEKISKALCLGEAFTVQAGGKNIRIDKPMVSTSQILDWYSQSNLSKPFTKSDDITDVTTQLNTWYLILNTWKEKNLFQIPTFDSRGKVTKIKKVAGDSGFKEWVGAVGGSSSPTVGITPSLLTDDGVNVPSSTPGYRPGTKAHGLAGFFGENFYSRRHEMIHIENSKKKYDVALRAKDYLLVYCGRNAGVLDVSELNLGKMNHDLSDRKRLDWLYREVQLGHANRTVFGNSDANAHCAHHFWWEESYIRGSAFEWHPSWSTPAPGRDPGRYEFPNRTRIWDKANNNSKTVPARKFPDHGGGWNLAFWDKRPWERLKYFWTNDSNGTSGNYKPWGSLYAGNRKNTSGLADDDAPGLMGPANSAQGGTAHYDSRTVVCSPYDWNGSYRDGKMPCAFLGAVGFQYAGYLAPVPGFSVGRHQMSLFGPAGWVGELAPLQKMMCGGQTFHKNKNEWAPTFNQMMDFLRTNWSDQDLLSSKQKSAPTQMSTGWTRVNGNYLSGLFSDSYMVEGNNYKAGQKKFVSTIDKAIVPGMAATFLASERPHSAAAFSANNYDYNSGMNRGASLSPLFAFEVTGDAGYTGGTGGTKSFPLVTLVVFSYILDVLIRLEATGEFPYLTFLLYGNVAIKSGTFDFMTEKLTNVQTTNTENGGILNTKAVNLDQAFNRDSKVFKRSGTGVTTQDRVVGTVEARWRIFLELFGDLFSSLKDLDKKIKNLQKGNDAIPEKSSQLAKKDGVKKALVTNSQCFMLNHIDKFVQARPTFSKFFWENKTYSQINGEQKNLPNVLFYNKTIVPTLLNASPLVLSTLQPRIRLIKKRPDYGAEGARYKKQSQPLAELPNPINEKALVVNAPFATHSQFDHVKNIDLKNPVSGRMFGAGIKEVSISQQHGNRAFSVNELTVVEISFHFNRLDELFRNWPVFNEKGKATYPYGYDGLPGKYASVAELVFPLVQNVDEFRPIGFTDDNKHKFAVVLEWGWSLSPHFKNQIKDPHARKQLEALEKDKGSLVKEYVLTPYDSEFIMAENGTVELRVKYHGIIDELVRKQMNAMFPTYANGKYKNDNIIDEVEKLKKEKRDLNKKSVKIPKQTVTNRIKEIQNQLHKLKLEDNTFKQAHFLSEQLQSFLQALIDADVYHRVLVPQALLGMRTDGNIVKWSPYAEMAEFRKFNLVKERVVEQNTGWYSSPDPKPSAKIKSGNQLKDFQKSLRRLTTYLNLAKRAAKEGGEVKQAGIDSGTSRTAAGWVTLAKQELRASQASSVTIGGGKNKGTQAVDFVYFGDLVEILLGRSFASAYQREARRYEDVATRQQSRRDAGLKVGGLDDRALHTLMKTAPTAKAFSGVTNINVATQVSELLRDFTQERLMFILGGIEMPVWTGKEIVTHSVNIADIPIHNQVLIDFILDNIVRSDNYYISYVEFVIDFFAFVLRAYFSQVCFAAGIGMDSAQPLVSFFNLAKPLVPVTQHKGKDYSKAEFEKLWKDYQRSKNANLVKKKFYNYCYLGGTAVDRGSFDYKTDRRKGIYHFYIGGDAGIVKKIEFKSNDIKGRAEANFFSQQDTQADKAMFMIPRLYDVTVTLVGNTLFESGQTFFVDPTMGTLLASGGPGKKGTLNLIKNTGLGGYYYITKVENIIRGGEFETRLEGKKIGVALGGRDGKTHLTQRDMTENMSSTMAAQQKSMQKQIETMKRDQSKSIWSRIGDWVGL